MRAPAHQPKEAVGNAAVLLRTTTRITTKVTGDGVYDDNCGRAFRCSILKIHV
jgi:hypothetical protein